MFDLRAYLAGLVVLLCLAAVGWLVSLPRRNVTVVDSLWALLFVAAAATYAALSPAAGGRAVLVLALVAVWALRLAAYLSWRNWGEPEDRRYREIRRRNQPGFEFKSLYLVFGLQAVLAWIVSLPLLAAVAAPVPLDAIDLAGVVVWALGFGFESIADWQLARFRRDPANRRRVMDRGLWRYTRHPNYFGECCVWWGFYLLAVAAGGWWAVPGPVVMTLLLLRVSGVALLEKNIAERRPAYSEYVQRTNAFFPGPPRPCVATRGDPAG